MNTITERNKRIKQALLKFYSYKDVVVKGDRGTAYGWVKIKVMVDRPINCHCKIIEEVATWSKDKHIYKYRGQLDPNNNRSSYMCEECLKVYLKNYKKVNEIISSFNKEFSTFIADDGYNTEHREVIVQVEVRL
jgi:hypothetical protein